MKKLILILGLISAFGFAQTQTQTQTMGPYAPKEEKLTPSGDKDTNPVKKSTLKGDDCPPVDTKTEPDCPKPKPKPKPCPEVTPCPTCETKVIEKTETKYIDRTVTIDNASKNSLSVLAGIGPHGIVTDYYETVDRKDEYSFRLEKEKPDGLVVGLFYQYRFTPTFGAGLMGLSNRTVMAAGTINW